MGLLCNRRRGRSTPWINAERKGERKGVSTMRLQGGKKRSSDAKRREKARKEAREGGKTFQRIIEKGKESKERSPWPKRQGGDLGTICLQDRVGNRDG